MPARHPHLRFLVGTAHCPSPALLTHLSTSPPIPMHHPECPGAVLSAPHSLIQVLVLGFHRRLQIEDFEARIALMPLLQAEKDRRWGCQGQGQEVTGLSTPAYSTGHSQNVHGDWQLHPCTWNCCQPLKRALDIKWRPKGGN